MEKSEVIVRKTEYSVYYKDVTDYNVSKKAICPSCGKKGDFVPKKIELVEAYNAQKMIPISLKSPRAREIKKQAEKELSRCRKLCIDCI